MPSPTVSRERSLAANRGSILLGAIPRGVFCLIGRRATTAIVAVALALLCGCGGGSGGSVGGLFSGSMFGGPTKMSVAPIIGAPQKEAQALTQALIVAGKERDLILSPGTSGGDYTLRGYLVASAESRGSKISYIWDVTDTKGERVARVSGEETIAKRAGRDPWSGVDAAALRSIADTTTSKLAASLGKSSRSTRTATASSGVPGSTSVGATTAAVAAKPSGPTMALVSPVSGAPGDGRVSLTAALKKKLYASGVKLAGGAASGNIYTIKGSVKLSDSTAGKQNIRIDWQVIDPSGKRLGTVSQENSIPKGSLNGPWGAIADAAAGAAADGIIKLLPKSRG